MVSSTTPRFGARCPPVLATVSMILLRTSPARRPISSRVSFLRSSGLLIVYPEEDIFWVLSSFLSFNDVNRNMPQGFCFLIKDLQSSHSLIHHLFLDFFGLLETHCRRKGDFLFPRIASNALAHGLDCRPRYPGYHPRSGKRGLFFLHRRRWLSPAHRFLRPGWPLR